MKKYNVTLSNADCIFDSRDGFDTAEEAVRFAAGRGGKYRVYVDSGNPENTIMATHYTDKSSFAVDGFDGRIFMTAANFARYLESVL